MSSSSGGDGYTQLLRSMSVQEPVAEGVPVAQPVAATWTDAVEKRKRMINRRMNMCLNDIASKKQKIAVLQGELEQGRFTYLALKKEDEFLDAHLEGDDKFDRLVQEDGVDVEESLEEED